MQCSTWWCIPSEATFRKYNFICTVICTLNVQTYALEMFKQILRKTNLPHGSEHRWALNRSIIGCELSWNHKRLTKTFPRRELTCFTKQTLGIVGMYPLREHLSWLEYHMHSFWMFKRVSTILKSWEAHEDVYRRGNCGGGGPVLRNQCQGRGLNWMINY